MLEPIVAARVRRTTRTSSTSSTASRAACRRTCACSSSTSRPASSCSNAAGPARLHQHELHARGARPDRARRQRGRAAGVPRRASTAAPRLSLSCNPDVSLDLMRSSARAPRGRATCVVFAAQINDQLPFMYGDALVGAERFDYVVDAPGQSYTLFGTPKTAVGDADYMIGLYASSADQGRRRAADRHRRARRRDRLRAACCATRTTRLYQAVLRTTRRARALRRRRSRASARPARFEQGLFAATEMLVDGFMHLIDAGIVQAQGLRRRGRCRGLLNEGRIDERVTPRAARRCCAPKAIRSVLGDADFGLSAALRRSCAPTCAGADGQVVLPDGARVHARPERCRGARAPRPPPGRAAAARRDRARRASSSGRPRSTAGCATLPDAQRAR